MRRVLQEDGHKYADGHQFGDGPNWRIRVARIGLQSLGLNPNEVLRHGIRREVYAMPIATNAREFLAGRDEEPVFDSKTVDEISALLGSDGWCQGVSVDRPIDSSVENIFAMS